MGFIPDLYKTQDSDTISIQSIASDREIETLQTTIPSIFPLEDSDTQTPSVSI